MTAEELWPHIKRLAEERFAATRNLRVGISHIKLKKDYGLSEEQIRTDILRCVEDDPDYSGEYYLGDLSLWKRR